MTYKYATTMTPGYFGNVTSVLSVHKTAKAALSAAKRSEYVDECGNKRHPVTAVAS